MRFSTAVSLLGLVSLLDGAASEPGDPARNTWSPGVKTNDASVEDCTQEPAPDDASPTACHPGRTQYTGDNPASERGDRIDIPYHNGHLNFMECNDDLRWEEYGDASDPTNVAQRQTFFSSVGREARTAMLGQDATVARGDGRKLDKWLLVLGLRFRGLAQVNTADDVYVEHEKPVSATAIWEFWTTGEKGSPNERFWVSTDLTVRGKPTDGARYVPEDGSFQSSDKFVFLDETGKPKKNSTDGFQYKSGHVNIVYECQVLYTDTGVPDRRDGGCKHDHCGKSNEQIKEQVKASAPKAAEDLAPAPQPQPSSDHDYPHKMAWYMFLTASAGPDQNNSPKYRGMPESSTQTPQTCGDLGKTSGSISGVGSGSCPNTASARAPPCKAGTEGCAWHEQPLCPNCVPSTNYQGADFQGKTSTPTMHEEFGRRQLHARTNKGSQPAPLASTLMKSIILATTIFRFVSIQ